MLFGCGIRALSAPCVSSALQKAQAQSEVASLTLARTEAQARAEELRSELVQVQEQVSYRTATLVWASCLVSSIPNEAARRVDWSWQLSCAFDEATNCPPASCTHNFTREHALALRHKIL